LQQAPFEAIEPPIPFPHQKAPSDFRHSFSGVPKSPYIGVNPCTSAEKGIADRTSTIPANHVLMAMQTTALGGRAIQALFQLSYSPEMADLQGFIPEISGTASPVYRSMCRDMRRSTWFSATPAIRVAERPGGSRGSSN
jgi:hypothetical protein